MMPAAAAIACGVTVCRFGDTIGATTTLGATRETVSRFGESIRWTAAMAVGVCSAGCLSLTACRTACFADAMALAAIVSAICHGASVKRFA